MRKVLSSNEFFDLLDKIGEGKFVSIGYVTGANLNVPKVKRINPLTNRMKGYADYSVFDGGDEIGALVNITSYNLRYQSRKAVGKKYGEFKQASNVIRGKYGLDPVQDKEGYKEGTTWSDKAPEVYKGQNDALKDHSYNPQNTFGANIKSTTYAVNKEGHIIRALSDAEIEPYLQAKKEIAGVSALRKMEVEQEAIDEYIKEMLALKFSYKNFESNSILWMVATIEGEKVVYLNDKLQRTVDDINIAPQDFRQIAMKRYNIELSNLHEMARPKHKLVRITESDIHNMVMESVRNILAEIDGTELSDYGYDARQMRNMLGDYDDDELNVACETEECEDIADEIARNLCAHYGYSRIYDKDSVFDFEFLANMLKDEFNMEYLGSNDEDEAHYFGNTNFKVTVWPKTYYPRLGKFRFDNFHVDLNY